MSKRVTKLFTTKASSIDEESRSVTFVISTNEEDRYGEVVDQKSWDFKSYLKNPLVLWGHDSYEPENVLGSGSDLAISKDGSQTTARLTFAADINEKARLVWDLIKRGILRTVSVGFINHSFEVENDIPVLKDNELLEISVVPIPANSGAVALGLKAGDMNRKDARWLMDSMRKEADLLEEQYKAAEPNKEKSMTPEQATAMIEGMAKLTEKVDALAAENQTLREQIETEQQAREDAAAQAEAEKKAAEEEEAKRKAEEDANKDDPAKGGDDDQPGAGTSDDIEDDTELTPELQAQIDAELDAEDAS
jgi:HK97 family phage prohead protease